MSRYVRNPSKTFEFDGDKVTAVFKPLSALDLAQMTDNSTRSDEVRVMGEVLSKNIQEVRGLLDADGSPIDVHTLATDAYFVGLAAEMFKALVEFSQPANP